MWHLEASLLCTVAGENFGQRTFIEPFPHFLIITRHNLWYIKSISKLVSHYLSNILLVGAIVLQTPVASKFDGTEYKPYYRTISWTLSKRAVVIE